MRYPALLLVVLASTVCAAQQNAPDAPAAAPVRTEFHVRYVSGSNVYVDGGRDAGLAEGTKLELKQAPAKPTKDGEDAAVAPGIVARLTVVAIASTSAVCEVVSTTRELQVGDVVSLPDAEVEKLVEKHTLGNTRIYPMVVSFTEGDPLDEEVRDAIPHPPLPEINQAQGRIGFDMSTIQSPGQRSSSSYGLVLRADYSRILGSHWNLNGYWRGNVQSGSTPSQPTMQDLLNRTYEMSLTYLNPATKWSAGIGRLYLPWAPSLEVIDGGYVTRTLTENTVAGAFGGSTPDPAAWNYNPQRQIGGLFWNAHGGSFERLHYSSTAGVGIDLLSWSIDRPFVFTENNFSFKRIFSVYHSMQIDKPTANPATPAVSAGIGQSLLSLRVQVHPRVELELSDTYLRDVPTYNSVLASTGLLDSYLFQGVNGGAHIDLPRQITADFTLGSSSNSTDPKSSLNMMFGGSMSHIWKTGMQAGFRYSKFDSAFASGNYKTITVSRDLGERFRMNLQGGRQVFQSTLTSNTGSYFVNLVMDTNLGPRYFVQCAFTKQMGGLQDYNQWTSTFGFRFDNRQSKRTLTHANQP